MNPLLLHCGADYVSRAELALLPTPAALGPRHAVRPFIADVELVHSYFHGSGIVVESEAYGVQRDADGCPTRFFGVVQVHVDGFDGSQGYGLMVALRGSYNQTLARALAVGSRVFVCDNLAFSGEVKLQTKQTTNVSQRLPTMLREAVDKIPMLAKHQHERFEAYRNESLTKERGDHLLIEMVRREALAPSYLGRAISEWDVPNHVEHTSEGRTIWRLHNAVTEAIKPTNNQRAAVPAAWQRTRIMTELLDETIGLDQLRKPPAQPVSTSSRRWIQPIKTLSSSSAVPPGALQQSHSRIRDTEFC